MTRWLPILGVFAATLLAQTALAADSLTVYAAASLSDVLPAVAASWKSHGGEDVVFSFDASSRLSKQLAEGAPADLFFSADEAWMYSLSKQSLLIEDSRTNLLSNHLVVIVPESATMVPKSIADLTDPAYAHLALADENVPAGKYARQSLSVVGSVLAPRVVNADNVRGALAWVARGEAEIGVVYATDALVEPKVKVAFVIPDSAHDAIVYPAAMLLKAQPKARDFLTYCRSTEAKQLFEHAGFVVLP